MNGNNVESAVTSLLPHRLCNTRSISLAEVVLSVLSMLTCQITEESPN